MNLVDVLILVIGGSLVFQIWRLRANAENARAYAARYCQQNSLQFVSIARIRSGFEAVRGRKRLCVVYGFEFSSNGENCYQGTIIMSGGRILATEIPPYTIN